jgi:hypothetical protein
MCSKQSRPIDRGSHILGAQDKKQQVGKIYLKPDGVASSAESPHVIAAGEVRHGSGLCIKPGASTAPSWLGERTDRRHHSPRPAAACGGGSAPQLGARSPARIPGGAGQLVCVWGNELEARRRRPDLSAAAAEARVLHPWPRRAPAT